MDRRLVDALRAASDALRAAAHALEEFGDERGPSYREDFERREREYRGSDSDRRDWGPDSRSRQDDDEPREAEAHPPLPPMPPYPPFPLYPPFPPYPPMPPIIIACGCAFQHGGGAWGGGQGLNPGWPVSHFAATPAPMQAPAAAASQTAAPPVVQGQTASAVPAGGISFAVETSAATERSDANGEPGLSS
jgi:hypothetical protein